MEAVTWTFRMPWGALMSFSSEAGSMKGICATLGLHYISSLSTQCHLTINSVQKFMHADCPI